MRILVTGGTGLLGRCVVGRLVTAGHRVRVLSRDPSRAVSPHQVELSAGDLRSPVSLRSAVSGVEVVVHCASDARSAKSVDVAGTSHLLDAMSSAGVAHVVYVSIVGVDRIPLGYYRAKHSVELMVEDHGVPWTIQRATQFHPFVADMLARSARMPVIACPPRLRFQPIAVEQVADRLVQLVTEGPLGRVDDLGGPEVQTLRELASTWLSATGRRRPLLRVPFPGAVGRAFSDGANLCPEQSSGGPTWRQYLDDLHLPVGS